MYWSRFLWLSLLLLGAQGREVARPGRQMVSPQISLQPAIERGLLRLSLGLQRAAAATSPEGENVIFAPLSIAAVHALLLAASSNVTKKELEVLFGVEKISYNQKELHDLLSKFIFTVETDKQIEQNLLSASGLFPQRENYIADGYADFARDYYQSEVISLDYKNNPYESMQFINRWVYNRTKGKIPQMLSQLPDPLTSLVIANAFYFKGSWEQPFTVNYTKMQNFMVSKNEVIQVPMMVSSLEVPYSMKRGRHAVIGLPYKGGDLIMYFILPNSDLKQFVNSLTVESVKEMINQTSRQKVIVAIPRMRVEGTLELSKALYSMGLHSMFDPNTAHLEILGNGSYVSEVVHKVAIEVTEWGTEAAASTTTIVHRDGSMPLFRADRPFLFFIYHQRTNAILFWGTVFRPAA